MDTTQSRVRGIRKVTDNPFLNYYELETVRKNGSQGRYFLASRCGTPEELEIQTGVNHPDGVVIFALYGEQRDRVVLVRQFRYPINGFIYELPAGLIEPGEDYRTAGIREMKEETGLTLTAYPADPMFERPFYTTVGMTDESCCMIYGTAAGQPSRAGLEAGEDLDIVLADRDEIRRILREERVALNCAFMLMHFLRDPQDPFAFLRAGREDI